MIEGFLRAIDAAWPQPEDPRIPLRIIGCGALLMQADYFRGTKDSDVLETLDLSPLTKDQLSRIAGPKTPIAQQHNLYIDIVAQGIPFLPQQPGWVPLAHLNGMMRSFDVHVLTIVDVVVSKLKRFSANDRADIEAMIERELVPHASLVDRFRDAATYLIGDAREEDLPKYVANLHRVERDMFAVEPSEIELPRWLY